MSVDSHHWSCHRLLRAFVFSIALAVHAASGTVTNRVLTTAREVLSLTAEEAGRKIPVCLTGVVTVAVPDWHGKFFVQDSTGGIFVNNQRERPGLGDLVRISGSTAPGGYAPDIVSLDWEKLGSAPLPEPRQVAVERLMSGAEDGQRVEVSCTLRSVLRYTDSMIGLDLASGRYAFRVFAPAFADLDPNAVAGATVRVRGTAAASFNSAIRQLVTVVMFMPQESDLVIDQPPDMAVFTAPFVPLNAIAQYRRNDPRGTRVRVKGVVTYQRPYNDTFLHDKTGGLQIRSNDTNLFVPGEIVEAVGFPALENFLPVMEDAILIRQKERQVPIIPEKASIQGLLRGFHHADLVALQGKLLFRSLQQLRTVDSSPDTPGEIILTLQSGGYLFKVSAAQSPEFAGLTSIPIGSTLAVSGICKLQTDEGGSIVAVELLLPHIANARVLRVPDWWTPERLMTVLALTLAVLLLAIGWTLTILRKNAALKSSVADKVKAQDELQKAHDLLETRVQERTAQLKFEIGARKETEVRYDATVAERTRIAQELHDTLLQGFTGIGLKLDVLANGLPASLADTKQELQKVLERSDEYLVEARRAVLELRSPSLEKSGDFSDALKQVSQRAVDGTNIQLRFSTRGAARKPAQVIEDNFLRICEEAVANAVKHARPTRVEVNLEYSFDELRLLVRDDGCGFDPQGPDAAKVGHFGLAGIRDRARSMAADISLKSRPGQGTELQVTVRLPA